MVPRDALGRAADLSWDAYAGAIGYKIYRSTTSGVYVSPGLLKSIVGTDTTTYSDIGAAVGAFDENRYVGPYLLINAALNIVHVNNLAWQERKAESFVFTPLYCGSASTGFQPLHHQDDEMMREAQVQGHRDNLTLGKAVTISGAAASPNMGYHSSPAVTALMTVFNARLGCWMRNPMSVGLGAWVLKHALPYWNCFTSLRRFVWAPHGPKTGLLYLGAELLGFTGSQSGFVYLSDGGHFENLGIYELVRRRCRFIIASDAGADPHYQFEDLAGMIRKCRIDFGVRIEIDVARLRPEGRTAFAPGTAPLASSATMTWIAGTAPGILVYIKASLSGDEPSDVQNYATAHPTFPA